MTVKTQNLSVPTDLNPFVYSNVTFCSNHLEIDGEKLPYKNIIAVIHIEEKKTVNGIKNLHIGKVKIADIEGNILELNFSANMFQFRKELYNKFNFIVNYIKDITFEQRLKYWTEQITSNGYFNYTKEIKFHNNGDITENEKLIGNIRKAFNENKLIDGTSFNSRKISTYEPNVFGIHVGYKFLGLVQDNWLINLVCNRDVFDFLKNNLFKTGQFLNN